MSPTRKKQGQARRGAGRAGPVFHGGAETLELRGVILVICAGILFCLHVCAGEEPPPAFPEEWRITLVSERAREGMLVEGPGGPRDVSVLFLDRYGVLKLCSRGEIVTIAKVINHYNAAGGGVVIYTVASTDVYSSLYAYADGGTVKLSGFARDFATLGDGSVAFIGSASGQNSLFIWRPQKRLTNVSRRVADDVESVRAGLAGYYFRMFRPDRLLLAADREIVEIGGRLSFLADAPGGLALCEDRRGDLFLYVAAEGKVYRLTEDGKVFEPGLSGLGEYKLVLVDRNRDIKEALNAGGGPVTRTVSRRGRGGFLSHYAYDDRAVLRQTVESAAVLERDAPVVFRDDRRRLYLWTGREGRLISRDVDGFCVDLIDGKVLFRRGEKLFMQRAGRTYEAGRANVAFAPLAGMRAVFMDERGHLYLSSLGRIQDLFTREALDPASLVVGAGDPVKARSGYGGVFHVGYDAANLAPIPDVILVRTVDGELYLLERALPDG